MELMYFLKSVVCWLLGFLKCVCVCVHRLTWNILMPLYLNDIWKIASPIYMQTNTSDIPTTTSLDTTKTMNTQIKNT